MTPSAFPKFSGAEMLTALDQHTLEERMVSRDEYLHFIELRKQVDELLASGRYASVDAGLALKKN